MFTERKQQDGEYIAWRDDHATFSFVGGTTVPFVLGFADPLAPLAKTSFLVRRVPRIASQ